MAVVLVVRPWGLLGKPQAARQRRRRSTPPIAPLAAPAGGARCRWRWPARCWRCCRWSPATQPYCTVLAIDVLIAALFAASLHFIMGPGGMHSFGHAAYFGLGAYGAALLRSRRGLPMEAALVAAPLLALAGALRVRLVLRAAVGRVPGDADAGLRADRLVDRVPVGRRHRRQQRPDRRLARRRGSPPRRAYYALTLALVARRAGACAAMLFSPFGYAMRAGARLAAARRGDRHRRAARCSGPRSSSPAAFAGLAGALFAFAKGSISPETHGGRRARSTAW